MKKKRKARVLALQVLYASDVRQNEDPFLLFDAICEYNNYNQKTIEYAKALILNSMLDRPASDNMIQKYSNNWSLHRMSIIDRNLLRISVAELQHCKDIPYKVIIDEAVEIAKEYSAEESSKFVNGILDTICKKEFESREC